jgi:hypothetical protein
MSVLDNIKNIVKNFADLSKEKSTYDEIGYVRDSVWSTYLDEEKSTDTIKIEDYIKMQENDEVQGLLTFCYACYLWLGNSLT